MAGFGFLKPRAVSVSADETPSLRDLPMQDKLFALSAILNGDTQTLMQIPMLAAARSQAAKQKQLDRQLTDYIERRGAPELVRTPREQPQEAPHALPGATVGLGVPIPRLGGSEAPLSVPQVGVNVPNYSVRHPTLEGPATLRGAVPLLLQYRAAGGDIKPLVDLLDKAGPEYDYVNNVRVDKRSPDGPAEIPQIGEGMRHTASGGVELLPGYAESVGQVEGAKTGAQEAAKAKLDLITVNMPDGSTQQIPRDVAVEAILRSLVGGSAAGQGGGFGRSQTPADKVRAEGQARTDVERNAAAPQAYSGLRDQARATDVVISTIDKILGDENGKGGMISPFTAGFGANLGGIKGTPAHDLQAALDTIRSNIGFGELQKMRQNSPTGGALGAVSERENALLQSVLGSLDAGQSPDQFRATLKQVRDQLATIRDQREAAFNATYGNRSSATGAAQPSRAEIEAEMRRRGLLR